MQWFQLLVVGGLVTVLKVVFALGGQAAVLENPRQGAFFSGLVVISGWVCDADVVEIHFDGVPDPLDAAYGTSRNDTQAVCGDTDNGFGVLLNANVLGDGEHTARAYADGGDRGWLDHHDL